MRGKKKYFYEQRLLSYSGDFKLSVIRYMYANHLSLTETTVKFGIPDEGIVITWDRNYRAKGPSGFIETIGDKMKKPKKPKPSVITERGDLQNELKYLRAENTYLKKLQALVEERIARESGNAQKPSKD